MSDLANHLSTLSVIVGRVQTLLDRRDKNQALKVLAVVPSADDERMLTVIGLAGVSESCAGWLDTAEIATALVESDEALAAALAELDAEEEARRVKAAEADAEGVRETLRRRAAILRELAEISYGLAKAGVTIEPDKPARVAHYEAIKAYFTEHAPQLLPTLHDPNDREFRH